ncbi:MAG TPA: hypothetical protein VFP72_12120 [Kineosporiaceae bacterium]|nr:hypothetical protein [Kineosporiaceae bacterium]
MERQTGHSIGRTEWDKNLTRSAAITGAIGGALGPIMQSLGHYPTKALGNALGGILGKNAGHEAGHWLGETIKGATHEWLTDGMSGAAQHQGWNPDPFSTTAGALDEGISGLAGMGGRKGGHRYYTGMLRGGAGVPDTNIHIPDKISVDPTPGAADNTRTGGPGTNTTTGSTPASPPAGGRPPTGDSPPLRRQGQAGVGGSDPVLERTVEGPQAGQELPMTAHTVTGSTVHVQHTQTPRTPPLTRIWTPEPTGRVTIEPNDRSHQLDNAWWVDVLRGSPQEHTPPSSSLPAVPVATDPLASRPPSVPAAAHATTDLAQSQESPQHTPDTGQNDGRPLSPEAITWLTSLLDPPGDTTPHATGIRPWAGAPSGPDHGDSIDHHAWIGIGVNTIGAEAATSYGPHADAPPGEALATDPPLLDVPLTDGLPPQHRPEPEMPAAQGVPDQVSGASVEGTAWLILQSAALDQDAQAHATAVLLHLTEQPGVRAVWPLWRDTTHLADAYPSLLALTALPPDAPDWSGHADSSSRPSGTGTPTAREAVRESLQRTVIAALWQELSTTAALPDGTGTTVAQLIAQAVPARTLPHLLGTVHDDASVQVTATLARAYIDQTLHATTAAAPHLAPLLRLAHQAAAGAITTLAGLSPWRGTSPHQWATVLHDFTSTVHAASGGLAWPWLSAQLQTQRPGPAPTGSPLPPQRQTTTTPVRSPGDLVPRTAAPLPRESVGSVPSPMELGPASAHPTPVEPGTHPALGPGLQAPGRPAIEAAPDHGTVLPTGPDDEPLVVTDPPWLRPDLQGEVRERLSAAGVDMSQANGRYYRYWPARAAEVRRTTEASSPAPLDWARQWREAPGLTAVLADLVALTSLPVPSYARAGQGEPAPDPYPAVRRAWGRTVLRAVWHQAALTDIAQPGNPAGTAARVADVLTSRHAPGGGAYDGPGAAVTATLVQAFLDQTLQAVEAAAPRLAPDLVTAVHKAHQTGRRNVVRLTAPRTASRNSPTAWANLVTTFVTDVSPHAGQLWTHLDAWLGPPAASSLRQAVPVPTAAPPVTSHPPQHSAGSTSRKHRHSGPDVTGETSSPAPAEPLITTHPTQLSQRLRKAAIRLFAEASTDEKRSAYSRFRQIWLIEPDPTGETSAPAPVDWAKQWQETPGLTAVLTHLVALTLLPARFLTMSGRAATAPDPRPAARHAWGWTVLRAVWHQAALTDTAQPGDPAGTAARIADALTSRHAPGGGAYDRPGIAVTSALVQAFLDQTLHAVEAAAPHLAPDLVAAVHQARRTAWSTVSRLSNDNVDTALRTSPANWANLVTGFVTDVNTHDAAPQVWTLLHDRLASPTVPGRPASLAGPASPGAGDVAPASWRRPEWEEEQQTEHILKDPHLGRTIRKETVRKLRKWSKDPDNVTWAPWRARWASEGTFASVLAPALLPWPTPDHPYYSRLNEIHHQHGRIALATLWRQVQAEAEGRQESPARRDSAALARRVAAEITEVVPAAAPGGGYGRSGYFPIGVLARAFVEHTLAAVQAALPAPGEPPVPGLVDQVQQARDSALTRMTELFTGRGQTSKARWEEELRAFVAAIDAADGPTVWTALRHWLQQSRPPREPRSGTTSARAGRPVVPSGPPDPVTSAIPAVDEPVSEPPPPALAGTVAQAHDPSSAVPASLPDPAHPGHTSPTAWGSVSGDSSSGIADAAGADSWTHLDGDWLLQALATPDHQSPAATGYLPRTTPLDQAPWLHGLLSVPPGPVPAMPSTASPPAPSPAGSPSAAAAQPGAHLTHAQELPQHTPDPGPADDPPITPEVITWLTSLLPPDDVTPLPTGVHPSTDAPSGPGTVPRLPQPAEPAPDELLVTSHPPQSRQALREAVSRLFLEAGIGKEHSAGRRFREIWPLNPDRTGETSTPAPVDWAKQWQEVPGLTAVLAGLLALAALPMRQYTKAVQTDTAPDPYPAARHTWGWTVLRAVWHHARLADTTQPGDPTATAPATPHPAGTAARIADILTSRHAPAGEAYDKTGVAVASALVQAFLDQTLHAVETAAPDLITAVHQAHRTAWSEVSRLTNPKVTDRNSPTAWVNLVRTFVTDINTHAGDQVWTHLHHRLAQPAVPSRPVSLANPAALAGTGDEVGTTGWRRPEWEEREQAERILKDPGLDRLTRKLPGERLRSWSRDPGKAGDEAWAPWRARWASEGTFSSVLALALLPWPTPGQSSYQRLSELHHEHGRIALATLWRQVQAAEGRQERRGQAPPAALARLTAAEITEVVPVTKYGPGYGQSGHFPTGGLARAFVEHTLAAVRTAAVRTTGEAPGLAPDLVDHVEQAHRSALARITALFGGPDHASKTHWVRELRAFVAAIDTADGPTVWTALQNWLQQFRPPRGAGSGAADARGEHPVVSPIGGDHQAGHAPQDFPRLAAPDVLDHPADPDGLDADWFLQVLRTPEHPSPAAAGHHGTYPTPLDQAPWLHGLLSPQPRHAPATPSPMDSPTPSPADPPSPDAATPAHRHPPAKRRRTERQHPPSPRGGHANHSLEEAPRPLE